MSNNLDMEKMRAYRDSERAKAARRKVRREKEYQDKKKGK